MKSYLNRPRSFNLYKVITAGFTFILAITIMPVIHSCNESRITTSWSNRRTLDAATTKIIVIALVPAKEREMAQQLEKHLANDLLGMGYQAISAYDFYGPLAFCPGNDTIIFDKLHGDGITSVLTVSLLDKQMVEKFVPGHYIHPVNFMDYVGPKYELLYEPAHVERNTNYYWETRIYSISSETLIYFSQTTSIDPASVKTMAHGYGLKITRNMIRKKIISPVIPGDQ